MSISQSNSALPRPTVAVSGVDCDRLRATRTTCDIPVHQEEQIGRFVRKTTSNRSRLRRTASAGRIMGGPTRRIESPESRNDSPNFRRRAPRRVATMNTKLCEPSHYSLAPHRSSLTTSRGSASGMPRKRVSFEKAAFNQVPMLNLSEAEKNEIWYNDKELSKLRKGVRKLVRKGQEKLDETEDCWRGLESYVKQFADCDDDSQNESEECNKLILQLQKQLSVAGTAGNSVDDLKTKAQDFLQRAMKEGATQAAQDAAEAHAIYMETMDSKEVQACFRGSVMARGA